MEYRLTPTKMIIEDNVIKELEMKEQKMRITFRVVNTKVELFKEIRNNTELNKIREKILKKVDEEKMYGIEVTLTAIKDANKIIVYLTVNKNITFQLKVRKNNIIGAKVWELKVEQSNVSEVIAIKRIVEEVIGAKLEPCVEELFSDFIMKFS